MAGENLRKIRKSKGLTQIKVQMDTGIEQALLSKYENGERRIPTDSLMILADYYFTSVDYLLDRISDPKPYSRR